MKRFLSIFLSLVLCLSVCACGNDPVKTVSKTKDKGDKTSSQVSSSDDNTSSEESNDDVVSSNKNSYNTSSDKKAGSITSDDLSSTPTLPTTDSSDKTVSNTVQTNKKREPYSNAQGYVKVTELVTKNGRTYVEKEGKPFNLHSVHIRIDLIVENKQLLNKKQYDVYLREYFEQAALLGFNTVICQVHWDKIEISKDVFDFTLYECVRTYCEEYNLNVQWLWTGSDNCGYYYGVPTYIENDLNNYPRLDAVSDTGKVTKKSMLDYSNPKLVEREKNALKQFVTWLYQYDIHHKTVAIQILNEANNVGHGLGLPDANSKRDVVDKKTWVGGQKAAILHLMNELGMIVKGGPYRCITRYNFISYHCYYNGVANDETEEVLALPGIDIVGMDCFDTGMSMDKTFMTKCAVSEANIPHIPESLAGVYSIFGKMMNAFKLGGNIFAYELQSTDGYDNLSLFRLDDYKFIERDGTASVGSVLEAKTADWRSFNYMVDAVGYMLSVSDMENFVPFNIETQSTNISDKKTVAGLEVTFNSSTEKESYGSVGFCMKAADGSYLFYSQKGTTTFTLENATLSGNISKGYYDADGKWVETGVIAKTGNGFVVTPLQASKGSVFRITPNQLAFK